MSIENLPGNSPRGREEPKGSIRKTSFGGGRPPEAGLPASGQPEAKAVALWAFALPPALGLAAFGLYWCTAARTITWGHGGADGPELSAAAAVLGIAHPTGYPLYLLLGHLFTLLPLGEVAFRVALLSSVAAAAGVALAAVAVDGLSPSPRPRLAGMLAAGVALATSPIYWSQATIPEVYALSAALVLAALALLVRWQPGRDRLLVALALLFGLGMGVHITLALLAGAGALLVVALDPGVLRRRVLFLASLAFLLGTLVYLYLPLRAAAGPPLNWGDPSSAPRFLAHVTGAAYRGYLGGRPLAEVLARVPVVARLLGEQFTWPGLVLALLGLSAIGERRPALARALLGYLLLTVLFTLFYNAENGENYLLPAIVVLAVCLGTGIASLAVTRSTLVLALALAVLLPLWQLWSYGPAMDLSNDRVAATYARDTLGNALPDSVLLTERDEQTFALWYAQIVEGLRPDVAVVDLRLLRIDWYREQLERKYPGVVQQVSP